MIRNLDILDDEGKNIILKNPKYSLTVSECDELKQYYDESDLFHLIGRIYHIGFARGVRYEHAKNRRKAVSYEHK